MNIVKSVLPILILLTLPFTATAGIVLPGLEAPVTVQRDANGVPHISADNDHDLFFMQGRIHAEDRLFQMDLLRRSAAGTLAELLGPAAVPTDVEARTIGLDRAAERSLAAHPAEMLAILQAYSDGVNSFLDEPGRQLPPEYGALMLTQVEPWKPIDSVLVGKALGAATSLIVTDDIDLSIALGTYQAVGAFANFDGNKLFFEDLFRSTPFDSASTIPDALEGFDSNGPKKGKKSKKDHSGLHAHGKTDKHARDYVKRIRKLPKIPGAMPLEGGDMGGSNSWVIAGTHTKNGHPILANDMHLRLENPTIFHELHLAAPGIDVAGSSLPGAPCVVRGHNRSITWGITNARLDVTDVYSEVLVPVAGPAMFATIQNGVQEPLEPVLETFHANVSGNVEPYLQDHKIMVVPRRNNGPLITAPVPASWPFAGAYTAMSVQSVGFGPTRDPEGLCAINRANNLGEFKAALQLIDFASQNFTYADTEGNIGYFVSGEVPLREDLLNPVAAVTPPFLIRNGYAGNSWAALDGPPAEDQATPFQILPFDEMPQLVNPPGGFIVSANNDQAGNTLDNNPLNDFRDGGPGLRYLNWGGRNFSIRAGRETEMIGKLLSHGKKKVSRKQMQEMQADTVLNDAKAQAPYIHEAYKNGKRKHHAHPLLAALAADPRIKEAVKRLRKWNFTTPTGIPEGYDAKPSKKGDASASVAATIYSTWRGKMVANSIDSTLDGFGLADVPRPAQREEVVTALKHLLENDGVGVSGLNFFNVVGVDDARTRRDILVLASLADALDLLASDAFAPAFANSTDQDDYRWGRLHRIVMRHVLGDVAPVFNVPPAFGFFAPPLADLDGIPTDGGFETVDEAPPAVGNVRVSDSDSFMFNFGPTGRFVAGVEHGTVKAVTSLPGGESAVPGSPYYVNLLEPWLRNESFPLQDPSTGVLSTQLYLP
jgi:penicillin amidase